MTFSCWQINLVAHTNQRTTDFTFLSEASEVCSDLCSREAKMMKCWSIQTSWGCSVMLFLGSRSKMRLNYRQHLTPRCLCPCFTAAGVHGQREEHRGRGLGSGPSASQHTLPLLRAGDHRCWREVLYRPGAGTQGKRLSHLVIPLLLTIISLSVTCHGISTSHWRNTRWWPRTSGFCHRRGILQSELIPMSNDSQVLTDVLGLQHPLSVLETRHPGAHTNCCPFVASCYDAWEG